MYIVGFCICILCCSRHIILTSSAAVSSPARRRIEPDFPRSPIQNAPRLGAILPAGGADGGLRCGEKRRRAVRGGVISRDDLAVGRRHRRVRCRDSLITHAHRPHSLHSARYTSVPPSSGASPCPLAHTDAIPTAGDCGRRKERNSHGEAYHPVKISWPLHLK